MPFIVDTERRCNRCNRWGFETEPEGVRMGQPVEFRQVNRNGELRTVGTCRDCESEMGRARQARRRQNGASVPPITTGRLGVNRRFGVEIECYLPGGCRGVAGCAVEEEIASAGLGRWRMGTDGSLGAGGIELRSPPLSGQDGLDNLRQVFAILLRNGATITRRCGLHVHHEARDLGHEGLKRAARGWAHNQENIDWLVSSSRRAGANLYCRPWTEEQLGRLQRWAGGYTIPGERYKTMNLHSYPRLGTVEIRQHQGTLSFRKVEAWILFVQAFLDRHAGTVNPISRQSNLRQLFSSIEVDEDAGAFLLGRAMQFGAPLEQVAA